MESHSINDAARRDDQRFVGRVVLVTGSTRGIGRATAIRFAEEGAIPIIHGSKQSEAMDEALETVRQISENSFAVFCDLSRSANIQGMFNSIEERCGELHVLVNNAAYQKKASIFQIDENDWSRTIDVNVKAPLLCSLRAATMMKKQGGGRIIDIGSVHEYQPLRNLLPYSVSKGALHMLTKCMALELAEYNIRVVQVAAGAVATVRTDESRQSRLNSAIPAGRTSDPSEIASLICYLASDEAGYITGTSVTIDGGITLGFCASRPDL